MYRPEGQARTIGEDMTRPDAAVPPSLLTVADRVEDRLRRLLDDEARRWGELSADLVPPLESLRRLVMDGGKRLRPAFCFWAYVGAGGDPADPEVVDAGAAFEMLQAFALVHDDVMDGSSMRRGARTAHLEFDDRHGGAEWRGEGRRFGEGVAILIGDLAHVYADHLLPRTSREVQTRVGRAPRRAQRRPVPRPARHGPGRHRPRERPSHRPLQVGQVHDRAPPPRRRRARWSPDELQAPLSALRRPARRGLPAPRRPARRVR